MLYVSNAFSGAMLLQNVLPSKGMVDVCIKRFNVDDVKRRLEREEFTSIVGHADMASVLTTMLGKEVKFNRVSTSLKMGDELIWAQYNGPRLPEGATSLPEGAEIVFLGIRL
jgi:hypothetical protein